MGSGSGSGRGRGRGRGRDRSVVGAVAAVVVVARTVQRGRSKASLYSNPASFFVRHCVIALVMADGAPGDCNMAWRHVELGNIFREARKLHCRATEFFLEMSQCRSATVPQSEARPFRARAYYERTHSNNALWSSNGEKKGLENNNTALGSRCCSSKSSESLVQQRSPSPARACVSTFATLRDMPRFLLSSGGSVHLSSSVPAGTRCRPCVPGSPTSVQNTAFAQGHSTRWLHYLPSPSATPTQPVLPSLDLDRSGYVMSSLDPGRRPSRVLPSGIVCNGNHRSDACVRRHSSVRCVRGRR